MLKIHRPNEDNKCLVDNIDGWDFTCWFPAGVIEDHEPFGENQPIFRLSKSVNYLTLSDLKQLTTYMETFYGGNKTNKQE